MKKSLLILLICSLLTMLSACRPHLPRLPRLHSPVQENTQQLSSASSVTMAGGICDAEQDVEAHPGVFFFSL
jgi:hypothetical protein